MTRIFGVSSTLGGRRWSGGAFVQIGRRGDAGGLEDPADLADDGGTDGNALTVLRDCRLLKTVEIAQQIGSLEDDATALAQIGQLLLQHQGEKRAEHMAADGGV